MESDDPPEADLDVARESEEEEEGEGATVVGLSAGSPQPPSAARAAAVPKHKLGRDFAADLNPRFSRPKPVAGASPAAYSAKSPTEADPTLQSLQEAIDSLRRGETADGSPSAGATTTTTTTGFRWSRPAAGDKRPVSQLALALSGKQTDDAAKARSAPDPVKRHSPAQHGTASGVSTRSGPISQAFMADIAAASSSGQPLEGRKRKPPRAWSPPEPETKRHGGRNHVATAPAPESASHFYAAAFPKPGSAAAAVKHARIVHTHQRQHRVHQQHTRVLTVRPIEEAEAASDAGGLRRTYSQTFAKGGTLQPRGGRFRSGSSKPPHVALGQQYDAADNKEVSCAEAGRCGG